MAVSVLSSRAPAEVIDPIYALNFLSLPLVKLGKTMPAAVSGDDGVELPKDKASDTPAKAATIHLAKNMIYADDKPLFSSAQANRSLEPLKKWLSG